MNKRPVYYMQTDVRWKNEPYRVSGESATVGGSGCGPSCAAMLIETLTGQTFTPLDACKWSMEHGYKALNQGTYYSYFVPQFKAFNLSCQQLNSVNLYGNSASAIHDRAFALLEAGYYLIACMGKGTWTSSGHFVVVWWEDGKVRINDPASTKDARINGDLATFKSQVKYYWAIDARDYNNKEEETVTLEDFKALMQEYRAELQDNDASDWSQEARDWAVNNGIVQGGDAGEFNGMWEDVLTREQMAVMLYRFAQMMGKA